MPPLAASVPPSPGDASLSDISAANVVVPGLGGAVTIHAAVSNELSPAPSTVPVILVHCVAFSPPATEVIEYDLMWNGCSVGLVSDRAPVALSSVAASAMGAPPAAT